MYSYLHTYGENEQKWQMLRIVLSRFRIYRCSLRCFLNLPFALNHKKILEGKITASPCGVPLNVSGPAIQEV